jgi:chromate transporter
MADDRPIVVDEELKKPGLVELFLIFLRIGFTSFGGASRPMMHRESVERGRWMREKDFLAGFAISQVMPGSNPVNLALYVGLRARGAIGAAIAATGMATPGFCVILLMGFVYRQLTGYPATDFVLAGVASAGVGATISIGMKMAARVERHLPTVLIGVACFIAVGVYHISMVPVVAIGVPLSFAAAWFSDKEAKGGR